MYRVDLKELHQQIRRMEFQRQGALFWRIQNDVFQNVEICHIAVRKEIRVEFGILPLCAGIQSHQQGCLYNLVNFSVPAHARYAWGWSYADWTWKDCAAAVCAEFEKYLVPLLTEADCCETGFAAVDAMLKRFEQTRLAELARQGERDCAKPFEQRRLLDSCLLYMALKNEDYDEALNALRFVLAEQKAGYARNLAANLSDRTMEQQRRAMEQLQEQIDWIEQGKLEVFRNWLAQRETASRQYLA